MSEEKFDTLCLFGLTVEYPRSWIFIMGGKQNTFSKGRVNLIGEDILVGLLWEHRKHHEIDLQGYRDKINKSLEKKEKRFNLLSSNSIEINGHPAFFETMETAGRAGPIGLRKEPVLHIHCILFCPLSERFITLYTSFLPKLKEEYKHIVDHLYSTFTCIH
jgi:hypothetical protein